MLWHGLIEVPNNAEEGLRREIKRGEEDRMAMRLAGWVACAAGEL
jgi:hypothetical protein